MHSDRDALWKRLPDYPDGTRVVRLCLAGSTPDTVNTYRFMSRMRTPLVRVTRFLHKCQLINLTRRNLTATWPITHQSDFRSQNAVRYLSEHAIKRVRELKLRFLMV